MRELFGEIVGIISVFISISVMFYSANAVLHHKAKKEASMLIIRAFVLSDNVPFLPQLMSKLLDRIFGFRYLSMRSFAMSALLSLTGTLIIFFILFSLNLQAFLDQFSEPGNRIVFTKFLIAGLIMNIVPDFASVVITRHLLRYVARSNFRLITLNVIALFDLFVASFIGISTIVFVLSLTHPFSFTVSHIDPYANFLTDMISFAFVSDRSTAFSFFGIFFYSSLLPSIWLLVAIVGASLARLFSGSLDRLDRIFGNEPLATVGIFVAACVTALFVIVRALAS